MHNISLTFNKRGFNFFKSSHSIKNRVLKEIFYKTSFFCCCTQDRFPGGKK